MVLEESLPQARVRLQELLREVCRLPQVDAPLVAELEQTFTALRNYSYFVEYQRRQLGELCQGMERL